MISVIIVSFVYKPIIKPGCRELNSNLIITFHKANLRSILGKKFQKLNAIPAATDLKLFATCVQGWIVAQVPRRSALDIRAISFSFTETVQELVT